MATSSNQSLWLLVTGRTIQEPVLLQRELEKNEQRLNKGILYYKQSSKSSAAELKKTTKGKELDIVLQISKFLDLDEVISLELFQHFILEAYTGSFKDLKSKINGAREMQELLNDIFSFYCSERLYLLKTLKHIYGHWQDPDDPYQEILQLSCENIIEAMSDACMQYEEHYEIIHNYVIPGNMSLSSQQESLWALQNLKEQIEILELTFLFYKDFLHPANQLLKCVQMFQQHNYGLRQMNKHLIGIHSNQMLSQISHLQAMILLEGTCLEWLQNYQLNATNMLDKKHHLMKDDVKETFKELCSVVSTGNSPHISPMLLALALLCFQLSGSSDEEMQSAHKLGNMALQADVFSYLLQILNSDKFRGDTPVAGTCQCAIFTLMSVALEAFDESSLGNCEVLSSVAAMVMTHPRLRAEFWNTGPSGGIGNLLLSHQSKFPMELSLLLGFLEPLCCDESAALYAYQFLNKMTCYCEEFNPTNEMILDSENENSWIRTAPFSPFTGMEIPAGTQGYVTHINKGMEVISWQHLEYSAYDYFTFEASFTFQYPNSGDQWRIHANNVVKTANLVASLIQHNHSLVARLQPIIMQYLNIIERFSNYSNPLIELLSSCLRVVIATLEIEPSKTWKMLLQTGFPPYLVSSVSQTESISVASGCYGKLMGMWECPRGVYPLTKVFLDMLLTLIKAQWDGKWSSHDLMAGVCLTIQDVFSNLHKWRFTSAYDQQLIGYKCLQLFHELLSHAPSGSIFYTYIINSLHHVTVSEVLLDSISVTMEIIESQKDNVKLYEMLLSRLQLTLEVIILILQQTKEDYTRSQSLQQLLASHFTARATSGSSAMLHIVSLIHFSCDPRLPCVAIRMLKQLCEVAPMSLYSMLGSHGVTMKDVFARRLSAKTEDVDLKVAILEFITVSIETQPALTELFMCLKPSNENDGTEVHDLDDMSCMIPVLDILNSQHKELYCPPRLLCAAVQLIHSIWSERKITAMVAVGRSVGFWKHLFQPLFCDLDLDPSRQESVCEIETCAHIINTIALEAFNTLQEKMDNTLVSLLEDFAKQGYYHIWTQNLKSLENHDVMEEIEPIPVAIVTAQLKLVQAWRTLLLLATSCHEQEKVFQLTDGRTRHTILYDIMDVLKSQLCAVYSPQLRIVIATELTSLYVILIKKWMKSSLSLREGVVKKFCYLLELVGNLGNNSASHHLTAHMFAAAHMILKLAPPTESHLMIPLIYGVLRKYPEDVEHSKAHVFTLGALQEIITMTTDHSQWLPQLQQHTIIQLLIHYLRTSLQTDRNTELIQSILGVFHAIASSQAANALTINGVMDVLCLCVSVDDDVKYHAVWRSVILLVTSLLVTLKHMFIPHAIDFIGVHQEAIFNSLDLLEAVKSWDRMQVMVAVVMFVNQLSRYRRQWQLTLPQLHCVIIERILQLSSSCVAALSKDAVKKHIIKSVQCSGEPTAEVKTYKSSKTTTDDNDHSLLEELLLSTLNGCLGTLYHHSADLPSILQDTTLFDLADYPPLLALGFSQPLLQPVDQPTDLGVLTSFLSVLLKLLNKTSGGNFKSPSKSPSKYPEEVMQKRAQLFWLMERVVLLLLSQAVRFLIDPTVDGHDKQLLKRELSSELSNFLLALLRHFTRKGAPSPLSARSRGHTTTTLLLGSHDASSSRTSSLSFGDGDEQAIFKLADGFVKQFLQ